MAKENDKKHWRYLLILNDPIKPETTLDAFIDAHTRQSTSSKDLCQHSAPLGLGHCNRTLKTF